MTEFTNTYPYQDLTVKITAHPPVFPSIADVYWSFIVSKGSEFYAAGTGCASSEEARDRAFAAADDHTLSQRLRNHRPDANNISETAQLCAEAADRLGFLEARLPDCENLGQRSVWSGNMDLAPKDGERIWGWWPGLHLGIPVAIYWSRDKFYKDSNGYYAYPTHWARIEKPDGV
jgi:hypothetical protein